MPHKRRDVRFPIPQRRDDNGQYCQTEPQVLAERPFPYLLHEVGLRRRDHPDIHRNRPVIAYAGYIPALQHAQQVHLRLLGHLPDFVEKQRPAVGLLEVPLLVVCAPVNAPFSCPNSSLLKRLGVIAPQFTLRNGPLRRSDRSWMASATDSLPEPVSQG